MKIWWPLFFRFRGTMTQNLTTRLNAVNAMLRAIGETPINSLDDTRAADALVAIDVLDEVTRGVQLRGWQFNTDDEFPLPVSSTSPFNLTVPDNILSITASECESSRNLTTRGNRIYDRDNHTFSFEGVSSIKFNIIWLLDFDDMPEAVRRYVAVRSARKFIDDAIGDDSLHIYKERDEMLAKTHAEREERRNNPLNIFSNRSSNAILRRHIRYS